MERMTQIFRYATRIIDLRDPLGHLAEHASIVDFLEGLAVQMLTRALADQQDHRRRILERGVHAYRGVRRAGPARDDCHAGSTGELADCFGHIGRGSFVPADDGLDAFGLIVQRVEYGKKTLAGNTEHTFDTMRQQGIDYKSRTSGGGGSGNIRQRHCDEASSRVGRLVGQRVADGLRQLTPSRWPVSPERAMSASRSG